MKYLNLSFPTPEENLACDEVLLEWCENDHDDEVVRFWESSKYFVVLGYSNSVRTEVNQSACRRHQIPILRRPSGGGTVLQGPGCLNYSLLLKTNPSHHRNITATNRYVMERMKNALEPGLGSAVEIQGDTDLTLRGRKFSGNAQRRRRHALLFHGTILLRFDIDVIEKVLRMPKRQPDYRLQRPHRDFLTNIHLPAPLVRESIKNEWGAHRLFENASQEAVRKLATEKYASHDWNFRL